jgi:ketosteroid isomerase-like protein
MSDEATAQESRKHVEALATAWEEAMVANDAHAIGRYVADDWVIVSETGITKKDDFLAAVASGDLTHQTFKGQVVSIRQYGGIAIVTSRIKNTGAYKGQPFTADEWTTDIFVSSDGQWRCVHSHITGVKALEQPD